MRSTAVPILLAVAVLAAAVPAAHADPDYFAPTTPELEPVPRSRTVKTKIVLASLAGGALLSGSLGLYFHLQSRDLSDQVSAHSGDPTGLVYTPEIDAIRRDALHDRTIAAVAYGVGGALLVGAAVGFMLTDPGEDLVPLGDTAPVVVPIQGGALVGAQGRF